MEDQRNWLDASFKTYSGSLLDAWPYLLEEGKSYLQSVELKIIKKNIYTYYNKKEKYIEINFGKKIWTIENLRNVILGSESIILFICLSTLFTT